MPTSKAKKAKNKKKTVGSRKQAGSKKAKESKNGKRVSPAAKGSKKPAKKAAPAPKEKKEEAAGRTQPPKDQRQLVQERKILRSQSRWLQKALFALSKAEDDGVKLAEVRGEDHEPMAVTIDGTTHHVGAVTDSLRDSVMDRLEGLRVTLRQEHALMG